MIRVENLTKKFQATRAVDDISFHVTKGEVVGFLGPNGAGKTTTMKILTCFMPPTDGTASIAGMDIYEHSLDIRKRIGYLPESAPVYPDMGVLDYLRYVAEIRQIPRDRIKARIQNVVKSCGLTGVVAKDVFELSKGYRQRLGLAQALIHEPDIIILDEPTTGLDPNQIIEIRNLIRDIGKEKTILLSTHILPEVEATCSRVIIINRGRIVAQGTPAELSAGAQHQQTVYITVQGERGTIEQKLKGNRLTQQYTFKQSGDTGHRFELKGGDSGRCEELFRFAVQEQLILTELQRTSASLEDVFQNLTREEK
jgi:ABC-2 type transport system ATP-binding protein